MTEATEIIKAITEIANSDKIKKLVCPNVTYPGNLNESEVTRVLKSYLMFQEEIEKNDTRKA